MEATSWWHCSFCWCEPQRPRNVHHLRRAVSQSSFSWSQCPSWPHFRNSCCFSQVKHFLGFESSLETVSRSGHRCPHITEFKQPCGHNCGKNMGIHLSRCNQFSFLGFYGFTICRQPFCFVSGFWPPTSCDCSPGSLRILWTPGRTWASWLSQEFLGFFVDHRNRTVQFKFPELSQIRDVYSAGSLRLRLSGLRSRAHSITRYTFPCTDVPRSIEQLLALYQRKGFSYKDCKRALQKSCCHCSQGGARLDSIFQFQPAPWLLFDFPVGSYPPCVCLALFLRVFSFQCSAFFRNSSTGGPWALGWHGPMKTHPRCCENVPVCMHDFHCFHANTNLWQVLFLPSLPVFQGQGRHGTIFTIWIAWWLSLQPPLLMFWWFSSTIWIFEFFLLFHWVSLA